MKTKIPTPPPQPQNQKPRHLVLVKVLAWALLFQALTTSARSAVSLKDAAFLTTSKDITFNSTEGPPVAFKRYYSSRSHYLGWFGFGWCTDFEKKIAFLEDQKIRLEDCKMSRPEDLSPAEYKRLPGKIVITSQPGTTEFDLRGRLTKITNDDIKASITYSGNTAQISGGLKLTFDPTTKFVKSLTDQTGKKIHYEYDGDNLVAVKENKLALNYYYDSFQNIERIDYQDKTFETIAYDSQQDRVRLFRDRKGCIEKFAFEKNRSQVERLCQGRLVAHATFKIGAPALITAQEPERLPSNETPGELK